MVDKSRTYAQSWYHKNKEKHRAYINEWRLKNPEKLLFLTAKNRAKRKGIEFDLKEEDIGKIPKICPVLGIPIVLREMTRTKDASDNSPSLDRIDSKRGYVKDNVQIVSWRANFLLRNGNLDEFMRIVRFLTPQGM